MEWNGERESVKGMCMYVYVYVYVCVCVCHSTGD